MMTVCFSVCVCRKKVQRKPKMHKGHINYKVEHCRYLWHCTCVRKPNVCRSVCCVCEGATLDIYVDTVHTLDILKLQQVQLSKVFGLIFLAVSLSLCSAFSNTSPELFNWQESPFLPLHLFSYFLLAINWML